MPTHSYRILLPLAACVLALAGCGGGAAQAAPLPAEQAVAKALAQAQQSTPAGKLAGMPTAAHGKLTSYSEAAKISSGSGETVIQDGERDRKVWLVIFEGDAVAQLEPVAGSAAPPQDAHFTQVSVIINAVTGDLIQEGKHNAGSEIATDGLPALALPKAAE